MQCLVVVCALHAFYALPIMKTVLDQYETGFQSNEDDVSRLRLL